MFPPRFPFLGLLMLYVVLVWALRSFGVTGGSIDDAEQLLYSQSWAWAYSAHNPPGPTWIVRALQSLTGPDLLSVTVPKFGWWLVSFLALYACARRLFAARAQAVHTTLWLAGVYYVSWECVLNYSHSVQVLALSLLLLLQLLRMRRQRALGDYLLLGLLVALGLVSKFNFAVLLVAMAGASLWVPAYRQVLCDRRLLASMLVGLLVLTPVAFAQWQLLVASPAATTAKFGIAPDWSWRLALHGAGSALLALASWLSPLLLFVLVLAPRVALPLPVQPPRTTPDGGCLQTDEHWLRAVGLGVLGLVMALTVASRAAEARTHYFQIAAPLVLWLAVRVDLLGLGAARLRVIGVLCLTLALLSPLLLTLELTGRANITGKGRLLVPYAELAAALRAEGFRDGLVVAQDWPHALSGNLRPHLPAARFFSLAHTDYRPPPARSAQCLLLWQSASAPASVAQVLAQVLALPGAVRQGTIDLRPARGPQLAIHWALAETPQPCQQLVAPP